MSFWTEYTRLTEQRAQAELDLQQRKETLNSFLKAHMLEAGPVIEHDSVVYRIMQRDGTYFLRKMNKA